MVFTGGLSYTFANAVFVKLDYVYRMLGSSDFNSESGIDLAFGWVY
jgi:opacity protein-like surface antigen